MPTLEKTQAEAPQELKNGAKAKKKKVPRSRLPVKRSINLAQVDVKRINWWVAVPTILLILAAAAAFGKFAVADHFTAVAEARAEVSSLRAQLDAGYAAIEAYGDLNERYAHYTYSGMTREELERVDRVSVMYLLRRGVLSNMGLDSWSVSGNVLTLSVSGQTLQEINLMMQQLLSEDMVDYCTVSTAQMSTENGAAAEEAGDIVNAVVIVYLKNAMEEATNG